MEIAEEIKQKSDYCLSCINKPCSAGCPLNNDISGFIQLIKKEKYKEAFELLCQTTVLQSICGRICPHTKQCQSKCIKGIKGQAVSIGELESYIGDLAIKNNWEIPHKKEKIYGKKIAVVGGGPSGLTCAAVLAKEGYKVTIYEKQKNLGGILSYGIPEFRLENEVVQETIKKIVNLGIEIKTNCQLIAKEDERAKLNSKEHVTIKQLEEQYDAIFLSIGANIPTKMNIQGENLEGVYGANSLLEKKRHPEYNGKSVAVVGGGNVAIDMARTAKKLGAESVKIIYRRSKEEMPAETEEIQSAIEEGIEFMFQNNIVKIIGQSKVEKIECIKTKLIKKEEQNRLVPINIENSNYFLDIDYVLMAIGSEPDPNVTKNIGIEIDSKGKIKVNSKNQTSNEKIFAGGDLVENNKATVAWAARSGHDAAKNIIEFLN